MRQAKRQTRQKEVSKAIIAKKVTSKLNIEELLSENIELKKEIAEARSRIELLELRASELDKSIILKEEEVNRLLARIKMDLAKGENVPLGGSTDEILVYKIKELQSVDTVKIFNAIKSEEEKQGRKDIKLSRKLMTSIYKVNESRISIMRAALLDHGFIRIIKEGNINRYQILKELPTFYV